MTIRLRWLIFAVFGLCAILISTLLRVEDSKKTLWTGRSQYEEIHSNYPYRKELKMCQVHLQLLLFLLIPRKKG